MAEQDATGTNGTNGSSAYPRARSTAASLANAMRRTPLASLKVTASPEYPDWISATVRAPDIGEHVWCAEGMAEVIRLLGKTSDGSRLLELNLPSRPRHPFYAAASNVLVAPA